MLKKEDWDDLVSRVEVNGNYAQEMIEVLQELRRDFLKVCKEYAVEANAYPSYIKSLKY